MPEGQPEQLIFVDENHESKVGGVNGIFSTAYARDIRPHRPFFIIDYTEAQAQAGFFRTFRSFQLGRAQFRRNGSSLICGNTRYAHEVIYRTASWWESGPCVNYSGTETTTTDWSYEFDTVNNEVNVVTDIDVVTTGDGLGGVTGGSVAITTATESSWSYSNSNTCGDNTGTGTITLSDEVTPTKINTALSTWMGQSNTFKHGSKLEFLGFISFRTESTDYHYEVREGNWRIEVDLFTSSPPSGMSGDKAAYWNDNMEVEVLLEKRKNALVVDPAPTDTGSILDWPGDYFPHTGFPNGYLEEVLSEEITGHYVGQRAGVSGDSVVEYDPTADPDFDAFADLDHPLVPYSLDFSGAANVGYYGDDFLVYFNETTFLSATSRDYRITVLAIFAAETHVFLTDATTKRVEVKIPDEFGDYFVVSKVEMATSDPENPWRVLAWVDEFGDPVLNEATGIYYASPIDIVSNNPGSSIHLLTAAKSFYGQTFGYYDFLGTGKQYRVKTTTEQRTTPIGGSLGVESCGTTYPAGTADFTMVESYSLEDGALSKEVTVNNRTIGGRDDTPHVYDQFPIGFTNDETVLTTETVHREEVAGVTQDFGYESPKYDEPSGERELLDYAVVTLPLSDAASYSEEFAGGPVDTVNLTAFQALGAPAAGESWRIAGIRLKPAS